MMSHWESGGEVQEGTGENSEGVVSDKLLEQSTTEKEIGAK